MYIDHSVWRSLKFIKYLRFNKEPWLKKYIDTNMRKAALTLRKTSTKLMNNNVFGKTMENLRKRVDIQLIHREQRLLKVTAKPGFKSFKIYNKDLASVELTKQNLVLNWPIYVGFSILEMSKVLCTISITTMSNLYMEERQSYFSQTRIPYDIKFLQKTYTRIWKTWKNDFMISFTFLTVTQNCLNQLCVRLDCVRIISIRNIIINNY